MAKLLTMAQAGKLLGVSRSSVKRSLCNASIPVRKHGRLLVVDEEEVNKLLAFRQGQGYTGRGRPPGSAVIDTEDVPPAPRITVHHQPITSKRAYSVYQIQLAFEDGKNISDSMLRTFAELLGLCAEASGLTQDDLRAWAKVMDGAATDLASRTPRLEDDSGQDAESLPPADVQASNDT